MIEGYERLLGDVSRALDQDAEALDELRRARLRAARLNALEAAAGRAQAFTRLAPAAAFAAALILVVVALRTPLDVAELAVDFETVLYEEDIELIEDLEFFEWLESRDYAG